MPLVANFTGAPPERDFSQPIPQSLYLCNIVKAEVVEQGGDAAVKFQLKVQDGPQVGRVIFETLKVAPNVLWKWNMLNAALGWDKFDATDGIEIDETEYLGEEVVVKTVNKAAGDRIFTNVDRYLPADTALPEYDAPLPALVGAGSGKAGSTDDIPW